jgi:A/G-specific adenine glycosylase
VPPTSPRRDTGAATRDDPPVGLLLGWFADNARDLPWRSRDRTPWGVLVSEVMLQQTQVSRVEPRWREWMQRWPSPGDLAGAPIADALRAWQGLGYPRRALRLHQTAGIIVTSHAGTVPADVAALRALPGIGEYTAAAVAAFAFGEPVAVLDTNVRRVLARWRSGVAGPRSSSISSAERVAAQALLPEPDAAATWSVALMELGALVCIARSPACDRCPLRHQCAWLAAGRPATVSKARQQPAFDGSDRQARGWLLRRVAHDGSGDPAELAAAWAALRHGAAPALAQSHRALASLLADGLLVQGSGDLAGRVTLPGH